MSSHPISNFTPVALLATKPINPFSHYFTPPSLHACMGPIPITWMRGGGAFRREHQWVLLWYSEEVHYACCLGFSYRINSTRIHPEVRDSWCNAICWGLTRLNLRALLANTPFLRKILWWVPMMKKLNIAFTTLMYVVYCDLVILMMVEV